MEEVVKLELEIPQELEVDIYLVARLLQVSQNRFLADILSREVALTKERLLLELGTLFAYGKIRKDDLEELVGKEYAEEMDYIKKKAERSFEEAARIGRLISSR
ncbi:MAG: hypothetical protein HY673_04155 [Chloroflexi bacterium]|nr:hypothetical protein [Chloroflexota bacterium]